MTICGTFPGLVLMTGMAASSLGAQEVASGTGLEVDDPSRINVHLIPGHGLDRHALRAIVEREFALAGVEMTDLDDPREGEVLYVRLGEAMLESEIMEEETRYRLENFRLEFWRPVRYQAGEVAFTRPALTWMLKGSSTGGFARKWWSSKVAVCSAVATAVRAFLGEFLGANGKSYSPPDEPALECP